MHRADFRINYIPVLRSRTTVKQEKTGIDLVSCPSPRDSEQHCSVFSVYSVLTVSETGFFMPENVLSVSMSECPSRTFPPYSKVIASINSVLKDECVERSTALTIF